MSTTSRKCVALIAHDRKKEELTQWVGLNVGTLSAHRLVATKTTASVLLKELDEAALDIISVASGPMGGDQQIGAMIVEGKIDALIFFTDPLSPHPHDVDVKALTRLATVYDIPMACSKATANLIIASGYL
ncbi:MAG TPA: methylglyoxal synthase [Rhodospirillaceae bacterium]|jgi:methylglyoxal synthase|nr:methylglyoxal synthase [Rhodospirillaceae bacterium]MAX62305.1 methylglyoxal synthase [Rhodospirillaceae bacterium]MBB56306.1 methylglyoxal synthase [Rhodospirillaceae bacterium]HAE02924.1 methylglyoxal synthase [Rhodospirillaceae bacterium]HBM11789.1 methylglyoxal synthase [Rhodospirillaceae bacterium]|tara:strand:- start:375 stop:767 length:393 start_codon:yes stop_codon:yes gene_type:complete